MFSIREHTTVCERLRKNFGEKTNSFRGNIFIDRKKKKKRKKLCDREENIFVGMTRMFDIARYFSIVLLPFFFNIQTNKQTWRLLKIYNSKDFHLRLLLFVVVVRVRNLLIFTNMLINSCLLNYTFHLLSTRDKFSFDLRMYRSF